MEIEEWNNFCRVFELPDDYPSGYCQGGGKPVVFQMVDWFNPVPRDDFWTKSVKTWAEYIPMLKSFLIGKNYVMPGKKYLMITDFGESLLFGKES